MAYGILARAATSLIRWRQSQTAAGEGGVDILLRLVAETSKAPTVRQAWGTVLQPSTVPSQENGCSFSRCAKHREGL